jgi:hypothetical protein
MRFFRNLRTHDASHKVTGPNQQFSVLKGPTQTFDIPSERIEDTKARNYERNS